MQKATAIAEGDAICHKFATTAPPISASQLEAATPAQLRAAAPTIAKAGELLSTAAQELHALGVPDQDAAEFKQFIAKTMASAADIRSAAQAASSGDKQAFLVAARQLKALGKNVAPARQFGFHVCT